METPKRLSEALGYDLIEVFTGKDGQRFVWFLGRGRRDRSMEGGFSWIHYYYNIAPLAALLDDPSLDGERANSIYNRGEETRTEALDVFTMKYFYSDADTEKPTPFFEFRRDIEDGYYILRPIPSLRGCVHGA